MGIVIKSMDISSGEVNVNLNEELLLKGNSSSEFSSGSDSKVGSHADSVNAKGSSKKMQTLVAFSKYSSMFPEKVVNLTYFLSVSNHHFYILLRTNTRQIQGIGNPHKQATNCKAYIKNWKYINTITSLNIFLRYHSFSFSKRNYLSWLDIKSLLLSLDVYHFVYIA